MACNSKDGIDIATFDALQTSLDVEDLYAILEMKQSRDSWMHAEALNQDERDGR